MKLLAAAAPLFLLTGLITVAACGGDDAKSNDNKTGADGATSTTSGAGAGSGTGGEGAGGGPPQVFERGTISGDITWQVAFDATAKAAGATDCSYTRHYEGVEDLSAP